MKTRALRGKTVFGLMLLCVSLAASAYNATAAPGDPEFFAEVGSTGSTAGQLNVPFAVADDPNSGHFFVTEIQNSRVSEFSAWGEFIKAWGWGVRDGSAELQTCTELTGCQQGIVGSGPGQINGAQGIAVDGSGNVYVAERDNHRIQKFDQSGDFVLMFGGSVNRTKVEEGASQAERNVCTAASGDTCQAGAIGSGPGEFSDLFYTPVAVSPDGTIYAGDAGRIQKFDANGIFESEIVGVLAGEAVQSLAVDLSGIYVTLINGPSASKEDVRKLSPTGITVATVEASNPRALALDDAGNLYVVNQHVFTNPSGQNRITEVLMFDSGGACVICEASTLKGAEDNFASPPEKGNLFGIAANTVTSTGDTGLYVATFEPTIPRSSVTIYGPAPTNWPPPLDPPEIVSQFATAVEPEDATLQAEINPRFWTDTRYYVEYGLAPCEEGGCSSTPASPGTVLTDKVISKAILSEQIHLEGLEPGTTYHYRFVSSSSGGGPAFGPDRTFVTPKPAGEGDICPNEELRLGPAQRLLDCRGYELLTPGIDNVFVPVDIVGDAAKLSQATPDGESFTYSTYRALPDSEGAPYSSQYVASRTGTGWTNLPISPPQEGTMDPVFTKDIQYRAFLPDLSSGWLQYAGDLQIDPQTPPGLLNLYRRDLVGGGYEGMIRQAVDAVGWPELQGFSDDGACTVFRVRASLTPDASDNTEDQVYERCGEDLFLVSVLPDETPSEVDASAGTPWARPFGRESSVSNAVSSDGSHVYWSQTSFGPGKLFVRITSGNAETLPVSAGEAIFWAATPSGDLALFAEGETLYLYDLEAALAGEEEDELTPLASGVKGVLGASEDLSHVYFVSTDALDGGPAGKPNLYLWREGSVEFIATLSSADASTSNEVLSPVAPQPIKHVAQVTPGGDHLVFMSTASLTGYDNTDQQSGEADAEVFRYSVAGEELACVSCQPSQARPRGRDIELEANLLKPYWAAAWIPPGETQLYTPRVVSEDGGRVFFQSFDPLVPEDENGKQDVYEWEALGAPGPGSCTESSATFVEAAGGCVSLISSAENPSDSYLEDSSASGSDVFFRTASSLVPSDSSAIDIYDARVGGGFPYSPPPVECQEEGCLRPPLPMPDDPTPASTVPGAGNPASSAVKPKKCPKGKRKVRKGGKVRCVKKKNVRKGNRR